MHAFIIKCLAAIVGLTGLLVVGILGLLVLERFLNLFVGD